MFLMSELPRIEEELPSTDCGAVILSCDQSRLESELTQLAKEGWEPKDYEPLAEPSFVSGHTGHIVDASFGIECDTNDELYAVGHIEYEIARAYPRQRYRAADRILSLVHAHLKSNIQFPGYTFKVKDGELSIELNDQAFRILVDIDRKYPGSRATITVEDDYSETTPSAQEVYAIAIVWAQVCDFVIRLGVGKHAVLTQNQLTRVTLGQIADHPSDIEIALVNDIEKRRRSLVGIATLPGFDEDILSDIVQDTTHQEGLSPDEIEEVARAVVDKKRENYATLDLMSAIDQSDIIEALAKVVKKRKSIDL